ncbi:hypothetical protein IMSAG049_01003 [Clostridiales bacterium]|nr:hypothetical protein IMSAG049_01003 [Clostridiales bacterium]
MLNKINFTKKAASLLTVVCLLFNTIPALANENKVYISTAKDLRQLAENCTLDSWSRGVTVELKNNINLSGTSFNSIPTFGGIFEGNGYTISGISINANEPVQGFFRYVQEGAEIKDLTIKGNIHSSGEETIFGGIVGKNSGSILNCSFYGNIDGDSIVGGIAGINEATGRIGGCVSEGLISSEKYTGGIAGENFGIVLKCINRSRINISSKESSVELHDISIENLSDSGEGGSIRGHTDTGGIAGYSGGIIQSCQNYGPIGYQHMGYNVGGIVGRQGGYVSGCTNYVQVLGRKDVGGIAGQAEPFIMLRYSSDDLQRLDSALDNMQGLMNGLLDNIDSTTDNVTNRLNAISGLSAVARDSSKGLIDDTSDYMDDVKDFANDNIDVINDMSVRITDTLDRLVPVIEDLEEAAGTVSDIADDMSNAIDAIDDMGDIGDDVIEELGKAMDDFADSSKSIKEALGKIKEALDMILKGAIAGDTGKAKIGLEALRDANSELASALDRRSKASEKIMGSISNTSFDDEAIKEKLLNNLKLLQDSDLKMSRASETIRDILPPTGSEQLPSWEDIQAAFAKIGEAMEILHDATSDADKAVKSLSSAVKTMKGLSKPFGRLTDSISDSLIDLSNTSDSLTSALGSAKRIVRDLADKDPIEFKKLDSDYKLDTQELHTALTGISDHLTGLNRELKASSDSMTSDLRAINNQFGVIMDIIVDMLTPEEDKQLSDLALDTSDRDIYTTTDGKIEACSNFGKVEADLNVGGIVGAMGIEYDLDPEDDISTIGSRSLNFQYESKDVMLECNNYGTVISKKNCVGGIVGRMDMGTVAKCGGYGYVSSNNGDYVGGIAGFSDASIRDSFAKCILSGSSCIGGIAGKANTIENCRSIIAIEDSQGRVGTIAGEVDKLDKIKNNSFIKTGWAGIGGISYEGKAQPVSYDEMRAESGLPEEFLEFTLKFRANGSLIKTVPFTFGEDLSSMELPPIPQKNGYYGVWPDMDLSHMTFSTVLEAEYTPWVTVLTSDETGKNTQKPLALAEGAFTEADKITAQYTEVDKLPSGVISEAAVIHVRLECEAAGSSTVRLLKPENIETADVWLLKDEKWQNLASEDNGSYVITNMEDTEAIFCIASANDCIKEYVAAAIILLAVVGFAFKKLKKKGN